MAASVPDYFRVADRTSDTDSSCRATSIAPIDGLRYEIDYL